MLVAHPHLGKIFIFLDASVCSRASVTELEILTVFLNQYLVDFIVCAANCISSLVKNLFKYFFPIIKNWIVCLLTIKIRELFICSGYLFYISHVFLQIFFPNVCLMLDRCF